MPKKQHILLGTFILTTSSVISRIIGFLFRIFLSRSFGEEQIGLYQLIFPMYALCYSLSTAGIQIALSRCVAKEVSLNNKERAQCFLLTGMILSTFTSLCITVLLQTNASSIAIYFLGDIRCEPMIVLLSYALPFASIHSCICGYYIGLKVANISAYSQIIEQLARVSSVYILCHIFSFNIHYAVLGIVISEFLSCIFCIYYISHKKVFSKNHLSFRHTLPICKELITLSIPLTSNRVLTNILQSVESISIPLALHTYGYSSSDALKYFGVLTGMVMPCILFPSAITNSIATLILPTVADMQSSKSMMKLKTIIQTVFLSCTSLGIFSCIVFFLFSNTIGLVLFQSHIVSDYLKVLCWICPFLYTNATLSGIINGFGKTHTVFFINCLGLSIRIISIYLLIPHVGLKGYLHGLLLSQLIIFSLHLFYLKKYLSHCTK